MICFLVYAEALYTTDAFYPGTLAELGYTGYLRDQPVAQVQWYPLQYNPVTGDVRFYHRIRARITWNNSLAQKRQHTRYQSPVFENLLKNTLVNYHELNRIPESRITKENSLNSPLIKGDSGGCYPAGRMTLPKNAPALKIEITGDGIYKITYQDIMDAGLKVSDIDPRNIMIQNRGKEVRILVSGEDDGVFHPDDYILFYGVSNKDIYTKQNIYWLKVNNKKGKRMTTKDGDISGNDPVPKDFPAVFHAEEDSNYWQTIPYGWGEDHWFWGESFGAPETRSYPVILNNISKNPETATVHVRLKGRTNDAQHSPDHHTRIYLNDVVIDDRRWDGQIICDHIASIPQTSLEEGTNTVRVESVGDTGAVVDQILVNWIEMDYLDTYVAEGDALLCNAPKPGAFQFEIKNFTSKNAEVFDITDSENVIRIKNTTVFKEKGIYRAGA